MTLHEWAAGIVGTPFRDKGRTRAGLDCAGLLVLGYAEVFGLALPPFTERYADVKDQDAIAAAINEQRGRWTPVEAGQEHPGDAILLRVHGLPIHVGLVIEPGRFLHAAEGLGVCVEDYRNVTWRRRVLGFYRPIGLEVPA